jgi:hypothetical protein
MGPRRISVTGAFYVNGCFVLATDTGLHVGGNLMRNNSIMGYGTAIHVDRGSLSIGFMSPPR